MKKSPDRQAFGPGLEEPHWPCPHKQDGPFSRARFVNCRAERSERTVCVWSLPSVGYFIAAWFFYRCFWCPCHVWLPFSRKLSLTMVFGIAWGWFFIGALFFYRCFWCPFHVWVPFSRKFSLTMVFGRAWGRFHTSAWKIEQKRQPNKDCLNACLRLSNVFRKFGVQQFQKTARRT